MKLALIGYPLSHSLSAVIHKQAFKDANIEDKNSTYELLPTEPQDLVSRIKFLKSNNYSGFNVTIPLKVPISLFLDGVDNDADLACCANTVKILPDKTLIGYNTDIYGFKNAIEIEHQNSLNGSNVVVLGAGGAARAVLIALCQLKVKNIDIFVRNLINANEMVTLFRKRFPDVNFNLFQIQSLNNLEKYEMLVNTTPIGMRGRYMDLSLVDIDLSLKTLPKSSIVYDVIYNPIKTKLILDAQKLGLKTINGLDMLVFQAQKAFEIWTDKSCDPVKMKLAALEYLM